MPPAAVTPEVAQWLIAAWLCALGAIIGSFLNVVVYRLPRGMSLLSPASHCPTCEHPIRWHDNVPVASWLILGGRCRDCHARISPRYPLVEAATAVMFVTLGVVECLWGGANLPRRLIPIADGLLSRPWEFAELARIYAFHLLLLCTLWSAALIDHDRKPVPWRLFLPALILGVVAPLVWSRLYPVAGGVIERLGGPAARGVGAAEWLSGPSDGLPGLLAGLVLGAILEACHGHFARAEHEPTAERQRHPTEALARRQWHSVKALARRQWHSTGPWHSTSGLFWGTACVGLFLGWQAVCAIALAAAAVSVSFWVVGRLLPATRRTIFDGAPAMAWLFLATFGYILAWAEIVRRMRLLG